MAINRRSRIAILRGAKIVITEVGSYESNMLDIAARAEVSRATVYNHFADKEEMMFSLLESEIHRLITLAKGAATKREALIKLSRAISEDAALRRMVQTDPAEIAKFVTVDGHPLWVLIRTSLADLFSGSSGLIMLWLIGQVASPLTPTESDQQAALLAGTLSSI